jgi:hypothetical protein
MIDEFLPALRRGGGCVLRAKHHPNSPSRGLRVKTTKLIDWTRPTEVASRFFCAVAIDGLLRSRPLPALANP